MTELTVKIGQKALRCKKGFCGEVQKAMDPKETYSNISKHFKHIGITRVANITGLDQLTIPVTVSIRPLSKSLCVSAGKGTHLQQAMVSAAMESIELYHAENIDKTTFQSSYKNLAQNTVNLIPIDDLPLKKNSFFNSDVNLEWIAGWELLNNQEIYIPFSMVTMDFSYTLNKKNLNFFQSGSNGLASGNHLLEAMLSALYEIIERDACTITKLKQKHGIASQIIKNDSIPYQSVQTIFQTLENKNIKVKIIDCTIDTRVPTFAAVLFDINQTVLGNFGGYGTHLNPEIALIRAITEAVQGRCVYIAGARDDIYLHDTYLLKNTRKLGDQTNNEVEFCNLNMRNESSLHSFEEDYYILVEKLKRIGINQIIAVDLTKEEFQIPIVKMIVPQLEGYMNQFYCCGRRARTIVNGLQHSGAGFLFDGVSHRQAAN